MHVLMICYLDASFTDMFSWHHEKSSHCFILVKTNASSSSSEVRKQKPFQEHMHRSLLDRFDMFLIMLLWKLREIKMDYITIEQRFRNHHTRPVDLSIGVGRYNSKLNCMSKSASRSF